MATKLPTLAGLFTCAVIAGCSQKIVQVYDGPKLPKEEISILNAERAATADGADVIIRRVNGVDTLRDGQPRIEVLPGQQVVRVELFKRGDSEDAYAITRAYRTVTFDTAPGRSYRLRGTIEDGIGNVVVIDDYAVATTTAPAPATPR